jgi:hypothetical protein
MDTRTHGGGTRVTEAAEVLPNESIDTFKLEDVRTVIIAA